MLGMVAHTYDATQEEEIGGLQFEANSGKILMRHNFNK
jgi:hypothetical protein